MKGSGGGGLGVIENLSPQGKIPLKKPSLIISVNKMSIGFTRLFPSNDCKKMIKNRDGFRVSQVSRHN